MSRYRLVKQVVLVGSAAGGLTFLTLWGLPRVSHLRKKNLTEVYALHSKEIEQKVLSSPLPTRTSLIGDLTTQEYDVLVIGGGATGCGVALDSVSRGLKTAMVEKFDYSAGTSSRSTKLIHGGVRYLQKAILGLDLEQYRMVKEALAERANLLQIAPHLAYPMPIMLPVYKWWQLPYYWAGIKAYDLVAGRQLLKPSYLLSKSKALELFPMLKRDKLVGAIVYYDGQHEDARMCLAIALTAIRMGATCVNYTECVDLLKDGQGKVCGAKVKDKISGKVISVRAKCVINATGPYTDFVRNLDLPKTRKICQPSSGVHVVLPSYYSPSNMGLLDPSTSDGRVIFFLPWQHSTMAGTTDNQCELSDNPTPSEAEIQFILQEIRNYLHSDVNVRRGDVLSAWTGIRPLVLDPSKKDTQSIARNHIIEVSENNLITIAGGKWTTYRSMAQETMDRAIDACKLEPLNECMTKGLRLDGSHTWSPTMFIRLIQDFGLDNDVAQHLATTYGDRAFKVAKMAQMTGNRWPIVGKRLHEDYPYIEAEVKYAIREYACTAIDILGRRTRLAFVNVHAAEEALPKILDVMTKELGWSKEERQHQYDRAIRYLRLEMGLDLKDQNKNVPINFTKDEINVYIKRFRSLDIDNKGYITVNDLRRYFKNSGEDVKEDQLHEILSEVDLSRNAKVDIGEFLQLMSALRTGAVSMSRFAKAAELSSQPISIRRSGGGV